MRFSTSYRRMGVLPTFKKPKWCVLEVKFLGVMGGPGRIRPAPAKIEALRNAEHPSMVWELRHGVASFMRGFASVPRPSSTHSGTRTSVRGERRTVPTRGARRSRRHSSSLLVV